MNFEMDKNKTSGQAVLDRGTVSKLKRTFIIMPDGFFNGFEVEYRI